ncbi:response regulator [Oculatella sp. LEGE 06141]|uniref:response regulator n=1 Tax=Oculatella sp. LEGE 06141 TaxID=1828648 RepID=UPI00187F772E|nr:response regulator [Oculatella sp. LEGE 06141]
MAPADQCRILVVDDVPDNIFLLQAILEVEGYNVDTADCGSAALTQIQASLPDLVLLDIMMPDLDGYEVTRQIRQNQTASHLPIILITAYEQSNRNEGIAAGANEFICKPIDFEELLAVIQRYCSTPPHPA